tara:strand:+ start:1760 stop:2572 length:813 start_codon:yes stop_codon:yes gene_type:complete
MKNLIYQYWDGDTSRPGVIAGVKAMKKYAEKIGAEYLFEDNPRYYTHLGPYSPHYGQFKLIHEEKFSDYDHIMFADTDVFPVEKLEKSIFDDLTADIGICAEGWMTKNKGKTPAESYNPICRDADEVWAAKLEQRFGVKFPRCEETNHLMMYNSGMVVYNNKGLKEAKQKFMQYEDYIRTISPCASFYTCDQPYLHAQLIIKDINWQQMDPAWNCFVHYIGHPAIKPRPINDTRVNGEGNFIHIQLRGADDFDEEKLWRITNLPQSEWRI